MTNDTSQNVSEIKNDHPHKKGNGHDQIGRIFFGIIIIWLGVSFLLMEQDYFYRSDWWSYFLLGLGIIFIIEAIFRMTQPVHRHSYVGKIVFGSILTAVGASHIYGMEDWWPLIFIAAGIAIIFLTIQRKNES